MGCDFSKNQDVKDSKREKTQHGGTSGTQTTTGHPTTSQTTNNNHANPSIHSNPLTAKGAVETEDNTVAKSVAESWTDFRMKEREMFDKILNKTGKKFIYVSHSPSLIVGENYDAMYNGEEEEGENEERMKHVEDVLRNTNLFALPPTELDHQEVIETLVKSCSTKSTTTTDRNPSPDDDMQFIKRIGELTNTSVKNIKINEQAIGGELVVQLPTLGVESE